ncbi:MAG: thioredoxin family protein, partial [Planctomycetaceae bacterium]|nr:thioredoxin family protein [Planctomycetaceae bacterium]
MARKNTVGLPKRSLLIPVLALTALVCGHSRLVVSSLLAAESDRSSSAMPDDMSGMSDGMSVPPEASAPRGWLESLPEALELAEANELPIVLHFEATWCVACRQMDSAVLNQPEVQKILSSSVIGVRIDADRHRDLISRYHVESLPTEVLLDATGKELSRHVGNVPMSTYLSR